MSSKCNTETGRVFIPFDFTSNMQSLLDEMSHSLTQPKKYKPIMATLTTSDKRKTKIDLNICRPLHSSHYNKNIFKETEQRKEDLEHLIIVWVDKHMDETENEFSIRRSDLRQIIECLMAFKDVGECFKYIKSITQEKIFFIVSGSLGKTAMNEINKYPQIIFVYIYCSNANEYKNWNRTYKKLAGTFTNEHELITRLTKDVSSFFQNNLPINIINSIDASEKSTQDLTQNQARFMWSQIVMEILLDLPQTSKSKQDLIHECRRRYKHNNYQQNEITEFEKTYTSSNALSWYTRDSFLYRIVNKALRTQNIIYIFKYRFFIIDIFQQLTKCYLKFIEPIEQKTLTVYRGQLMAADEFSKLQKNINGFISINTFFSTSTSSDVVFPFAGNGDCHPLFESIFFEIELNLDVNTVPFVEISTNSKFQSEKEVLLCMGAVFRIEFIDKLTEDIWHVKLVSIDEDDIAKLDNLANYLKKETNETLTCLAMGRILQKMGEYDKAQSFYEILLAELPSNHPDIPGIYNDYGMALFKIQKNSQIVLNYLIQSLKLQMKTFPKYFLFFTQTLSNIASVYIERRNFKRALSLFQLTLQILDLDCSTNSSQAIPLQRSEIYNNISHIYSQNGQLSLAMKYLKKSLQIEKKILPINHPDIALSLNNIGTIYMKNLDYTNADKYFQEANGIVAECLPFEHHPDIAQLFNNIGLLEYNRDNLDKALTYYEKALEIQLKCLPPIHWKTAVLYNNMGHVYFEKAEYQMALKMFEKSLNIGQQCLPSNHPEISHTHQNIGKVYRSLQDYSNALIHFTKALQIGLKCLPSTHFYVAEAYRGLGRVYNDLESYPMAIENFQKALHIYSKNPPMDKTYCATLCEDIGIAYYNAEQYSKSLANLQKALEIFQISDENKFDECISTVQGLIKEITAMQ